MRQLSRCPSPLSVIPTNRFSVLNDPRSVAASQAEKEDIANETSCLGQRSSSSLHASIPLMRLSDLLLHKQRNSSEEVGRKLWEFLSKHGFVVCTFSSESQPGHIVNQWKQSLERDFFPSRPTDCDQCGTRLSDPDDKSKHKHLRHLNVGELASSSEVYISEKGVPMWKLGYELCPDDVREAFRVHAGRPDDQPWPLNTNATGQDDNVRSTWLQGLGLCRNICDEALQLTLGGFPQADESSPETKIPIRNRPGSGRKWWLHPDSIPPRGEIRERVGDYSVLYSMHYFNDNREKEKIMDAQIHSNNSGNIDNDRGMLEVNVKTHVDPSLFVVEPFTTVHSPGLQVFDPSIEQWIDCDGPTSPILDVLQQGEQAMIIFVGRAFAQHCQQTKGVTPTLHRVVKADKSRRTIIYEQKYEEYFPPPSFQ